MRTLFSAKVSSSSVAANKFKLQNICYYKKIYIEFVKRVVYEEDYSLLK